MEDINKDKEKAPKRALRGREVTALCYGIEEIINNGPIENSDDEEEEKGKTE